MDFLQSLRDNFSISLPETLSRLRNGVSTRLSTSGLSISPAFVPLTRTFWEREARRWTLDYNTVDGKIVLNRHKTIREIIIKYMSKLLQLLQLPASILRLIWGRVSGLGSSLLQRKVILPPLLLFVVIFVLYKSRPTRPIDCKMSTTPDVIKELQDDLERDQTKAAVEIQHFPKPQSQSKPDGKEKAGKEVKVDREIEIQKIKQQIRIKKVVVQHQIKTIRKETSKMLSAGDTIRINGNFQFRVIRAGYLEDQRPHVDRHIQACRHYAYLLQLEPVVDGAWTCTLGHLLTTNRRLYNFYLRFNCGLDRDRFVVAHEILSNARRYLSPSANPSMTLVGNNCSINSFDKQLIRQGVMLNRENSFVSRTIFKHNIECYADFHQC